MRPVLLRMDRAPGTTGRRARPLLQRRRPRGAQPGRAQQVRRPIEMKAQRPDRLVTAYPGKELEVRVIKKHDRVILPAPLPKERLEIGDVGTVDHVYADGKAFE